MNANANTSNQKTQETNIMLDMETLGTRPGCAILSIAAVPFSSQYDLEPFYLKISATSCTDAGLHVDDATVAWWNKQSPEAYREAFSGKLELRAVLSEFADYCNHLPHTPVVCYRTLKNLFPFVLGVKPVVAHNALEDAKAQAAHATDILRVIAGRRG